jgi:hypothetical protein
MTIEKARETFVEWISKSMTEAGRGDRDSVLQVEPSGKYWLGRLQSRDAVAENEWGDRGERLEPCAMGVKLKPIGVGPWAVNVSVSMCAWVKEKKSGDWHKTTRISVSGEVHIPAHPGKSTFLAKELAAELEKVTMRVGLLAQIDVEVELGQDGCPEVSITLVNTSPKKATESDLKDTRLYECELRVSGLNARPFMLESLEDSFRYDRRVCAYGINCGIKQKSDDVFVTEDAITVDRRRPGYWSVSDPAPSMRFVDLGNDPIPSAKQLYSSLVKWGESNWSTEVLKCRAKEESWSDEMLAEATLASAAFDEECARVDRGISLLEKDPTLLAAFKGMNRAMAICSNGRYDSWRPFQFGFLLANLQSITDRGGECDIADVVWFATGGGKTETYLGLIVTAALHDRATGKISGITAWSRFPLRMLSLQQTQRFADAMAAAEHIRVDMGLNGDVFSLGFFVGMGATPNKIPEEPKGNDPDPDDEGMPSKYRVLEYCPFCRSRELQLSFDRRLWRLNHSCVNSACTWHGKPLPFYVVDEEIYRFLPTVVVGTLDKAASIAIQASMRGMVGAPIALCSKEGHGYTYAPRSKRPSGCLVPGCKGAALPLPMTAELYGPSFRLQDELHLLRDSLGAVDSHYEALYDGLQRELCGSKPKILASSATLTGYKKQVDVLYRRSARVFPVPPPQTGGGFWTSDTDSLMRRFVAIAPRGVTIEYTVDRLLTELQNSVRRLVSEPVTLCNELGIDPSFATDLLSLYGTDVVYGNTLRDLEAVTRSMETQVLIAGSGRVNTASLTGKTDFGDVRNTLSRLQDPEQDFDQRLHIVSASSMMSHGVDVDRLNVMVMLGIPLTTAEFIQATARVGRRYPAIVFVIHKIGRERDAGVFRSFKQFIEQGDRFVEPIPITRRSRQVLKRTVAGLELARLLAIHEAAYGKPLTTVKALKEYFSSGKLDLDADMKAVRELLGLTSELDDPLRRDLERWFDEFRRNIELPPTDSKFPSDLSITGAPMLSLRDVEKQVPIIGSRV